MKIFRNYYVIANCYIVLYLLSILPFLLKNTFQPSIILTVTLLMQIAYCLVYLSLGYTAVYFQEKRWLVFFLFSYPVILGTLFILSQFDFGSKDFLSIILLLSTILLIVTSFQIRNSFIKPYFRYLGISIVFIYWLKLPSKIFQGQNSADVLITHVFHLIPVLIITIMLYKVAAEIKLMDNKGNSE